MFTIASVFSTLFVKLPRVFITAGQTTNEDNFVIHNLKRDNSMAGEILWVPTRLLGRETIRILLWLYKYWNSFKCKAFYSMRFGRIFIIYQCFTDNCWFPTAFSLRCDKIYFKSDIFVKRKIFDFQSKIHLKWY